MRRVGLIGLGLLGSALADRLLGAGFEVVGHDLDAVKRGALAAAGGAPLETAADVAAACETIVLSLPDSQVVAGVLETLRDRLSAAHRIIDTSTGDPQATEALATSLAERGIAYLDATILGSSVQAREGQAIVMVGGAAASVAASREVLDCLGRAVYHVGPAGAGAQMKLVVNLVLGLNRAALAEGLSLARALKLDPATTLAILKAGAAYSAVMDAKGPKMLAGDFAPQARLSQHLKDVRLMLAAAERTAMHLPLSEVHRILLERAEAAGYGDADNSAIVRAFDP
jgi:3-hydroxyisobutyrate dehydrogenase-like beta-hydroxyacid dehydrogenase